MRAKPFAGFLSLLAVAGIFAAVSVSGAASGEAPQSSTIIGTWKFVSRDLPDGTTQKSPDIVGLISFTKEYRNFNIYWKDKDGKHVSISSISKYTLTDKEYTETNLYHMLNEPTGGMQYDFSGASGSAPVKMSQAGFEWDLPLFDEPTVKFTGDKFTATLEGEFVDHWMKVD